MPEKNWKLKDTEFIYVESTYTPKASITANDMGARIYTSGIEVTEVTFNNDITVKNAEQQEVIGIYTDQNTKLNNTVKKTIKTTSKLALGDAESYGIMFSGQYLTVNNIGGGRDIDFCYNFNATAQSKSGNAMAAGICCLDESGVFAPGISVDSAFRGNFTVSAKATAKGKSDSYDAIAYGIYLSEGDMFCARDFSGKFKITAETKTRNAYAHGLHLESWSVPADRLANKFTGSITVSAKGSVENDSYTGAMGICSYNGMINLISYSGSINASVKGHSVYASGIRAESDLNLYGFNTGKITVSATGEENDGNISGIESNQGVMTVGSYTGAISVTASIDDGATNVYGIFAKGNITFNGDYTGKLNVVSKDDASNVAGIYSYDVVTMQDITGAWKISANEGNAYGIYGEDGISLGNVSGNKTITSKDYYAYGFYSIGDFTAQSISGKISVSAEEYAFGIFSYGDIALGDLSGMTLQVSAKENSAYGILSKLNYMDSDLIIGSTGLDLGKINVTAYDEAKGVYIYGDITAATVTDRTILSGTVTVKGNDAYGIKADSFDCKIGANVTANGKSDAKGIYVDNGDVIFEGAKITAKGQMAYSVYHIGDEGNSTITISGKSQLTGGIHIGNDADTVSIESGSKVSGGMSDVEKILFNINDASTKKKVMWNATADWGESALDYNIDFGLLGDFALAQKTKNMQWSDLISNFNDTLNTKYDNALYDYTVYEKGNTLYLKSEISPAWNASAVENKSTTTKKISAEYTLFTSKADINVKNGWGIGSERETETHLVLDNNITASTNAYEGYGVYSTSTYDLHVYSNNAAKTLKFSNKVEGTANAYGYYHNGNLYFGDKNVNGKFMQNITVSSNALFQSEAAGITTTGSKDAGNIVFYGTYTGKLTITLKDNGEGTAYGICGKQSVTMQDTTGAWSISSSGSAFGIYAGKDITLGNVSGNKTISGKGGEAYGFYTDGKFQAESISGKISVSAEEKACGIYSKGDATLGDLSGMTLQVSSKENCAYGILTEEDDIYPDLIIGSTGLDLGKINVTAYDLAVGVMIYGDITAATVPDRPILSGTVTVKGYGAYGIDADSFACKIGANVTVNGQSYARGIYAYKGDVIFEGAKITAKVSDKTGRVYSVYHTGNTDENTIALRGKSQLTGNIRAEGAQDTVIIESGSKLTGGLDDVENLILEINDPAAKKSLWDITADLSDNTNLEIDFELGMTGDFVLANNKSGAAWDEMFANDITLDWGKETATLDLASIMSDGSVSESYNDYDFTLKTKGSQLILSVKGN